MPTQIQYYNSSPSVTGILQPPTASGPSGQIRPRDVYPMATAPRIRPATGFQFRDVSPPRGKPTWNDSRKSEARNDSLRRYKVSLNHRPAESVLSKRAPFASRTLSASSGGHRYRNGHTDTLPFYNPMNDPHLYQYYAKKFGLEVNPRPPTAKRSQSAPTNRTGLRPASTAAKKVLYKVVVKTGDKKRAGTDARVFIQMKGTKGKINKTHLYKDPKSGTLDKNSTFTFSKGSTHAFRVYGPDIGDVRNITIQHDGLEERQAWYVDEISVTNVKRDKTWHFPCRRWFSLYHTDCQISRTLTPGSKSGHNQLDGKKGDHTGKDLFTRTLRRMDIKVLCKNVLKATKKI